MKTGTSLAEAPQTLGFNSIVADEEPCLETISNGGLKCLGISYAPTQDNFFFEKEILQI